jgi:NAD(P)H-quinone oxidoreductase subunit 5
MRHADATPGDFHDRSLAAASRPRRPVRRGDLAFRTPGRRPGDVPLWAERAALAALGVSALAALALATGGAGTGPLIGFGGAGFAPRLDALSATMLLLVAFVGWVVLRYARHLHRRRGAAGRLHRLALRPRSARCCCWSRRAIWSIWWPPGSPPACSCTGCCCSIPTGFEAQRAARKKWVTARLGDAR